MITLRRRRLVGLSPLTRPFYKGWLPATLRERRGDTILQAGENEGPPALEERAHVTQGLSDFEALHAIRVGGLHAAKPDNAEHLAERGLIFISPVGCMLTDEGTQLHTELIEVQRAEIDVEAVKALYERFLAVNQPCKSKCTEWQKLADDDLDSRFMIATDLQDILERVSTTIVRTSEHVPRFGHYPPRMGSALERVLGGEHEFLTSPTVASFHNVWMECHEDYLLTLGISREEEGSY